MYLHLLAVALIFLSALQDRDKTINEAQAHRYQVWQSRIDFASTSDQKRVLGWVRSEVLGRHCDGSYMEDIYTARKTADPAQIVLALERQEKFCLDRIEGKILAQSSPDQALAVIQGPNQ